MKTHLPFPKVLVLLGALLLGVPPIAAAEDPCEETLAEVAYNEFGYPVRLAGLDDRRVRRDTPYLAQDPDGGFYLPDGDGTAGDFEPTERPPTP